MIFKKDDPNYYNNKIIKIIKKAVDKGLNIGIRQAGNEAIICFKSNNGEMAASKLTTINVREKEKIDNMSGKSIARVKYNKKSKKYNILVNYDGEDIVIGTFDGPFAIPSEWDSEEAAKEWIKANSDRLILENN